MFSCFIIAFDVVFAEINISPLQQEAFNHYKKNTMSVELLKDDNLQKVNFRVKNKVSLTYKRWTSGSRTRWVWPTTGQPQGQKQGESDLVEGEIEGQGKGRSHFQKVNFRVNPWWACPSKHQQIPVKN